LTGDYRLEIDQDAVLEDVIGNLIDELGNNHELTEWVVEFAKDNLENERAWDIRKSLLDFSREIFREEFKVIEDEVVQKTSDRLYFRNLKAKLQQIRFSFLNAVGTPAREALQILALQPWDLSDIAHGKMGGLLTYFELMASVKAVKDVKEPTPRVQSFAESARNWPNKKTIHAAEIIRIADAELIPRLQRIFDVRQKGITDALSAEMALQNLYVFGLVADISRKLKEYKNENNLMLLADAPKFLNGVIQDSDTPFVYEKVGSFYRNYLIDEFQDTSGLQWKNFLPLVLNSLDQGHQSLVVGDVKQAIYRWRGGDLNLLHQTVESHIGKDRVAVRNLNSNYRSAGEIVDFNNAVFEQASAIATADTGHSLSSSAYSDVSQRTSKSITGLVEVKFLTSEKDGRKWKEIALEEVPLIMERLQEKGVPLKDIAILVRKNDEGQEVVNYILEHQRSDKAKAGFRYDVVSGESLRMDTAATVNLLEAAMKYLLNPDDAIARAQLAYEFSRLYDPERAVTDVFSVTNQSIFES
jgi:ATP-dependent helicase/nuclease subunit A